MGPRCSRRPSPLRPESWAAPSRACRLRQCRRVRPLGGHARSARTSGTWSSFAFAIAVAITSLIPTGRIRTLRRELRRRLDEVRVDHRPFSLGREGRLAAETLVQHAAEGIQVRATVDIFAFDLLRRRVLERAEEVPRLGEAARRCLLHDAEVGEIDAIRLTLDKDVRRLDVAVDQALLMSLVQCTPDLLHQEERLPERQWAVALDQRAEVLALHEAHRDVEDAFGLACVVDGDDVRVVERRPRAATRERTDCGRPRRQRASMTSPSARRCVRGGCARRNTQCSCRRARARR